MGFSLFFPCISLVARSRGQLLLQMSRYPTEACFPGERIASFTGIDERCFTSEEQVFMEGELYIRSFEAGNQEQAALPHPRRTWLALRLYRRNTQPGRR
jgi:hypothetical protein